MEKFSAKNVHNEETVAKLSKAQYSLFGMLKQIRILVMAVACLLVSVLYEMSEIGRFALMLFGGWMLMSYKLPEKRQTEKMLEAMKGKFPATQFSFSDDAFSAVVKDSETKYGYSKVVGLAADDSYYYLFISPFAGYIFPKKNLKPSKPADFEAFITQKTELVFVRPCSLLNLRLKEIRKRVRNVRVLRERKKIRKLPNRKRR